MKNSYAVVDAAVVRAACDAYLKSRENRINEKIEALIQGEMQRMFFKAKTREQALARLDESIRELKWTGSYWSGRVEDLRALTFLSADGMIRLNSDDASLLSEYWT